VKYSERTPEVSGLTANPIIGKDLNTYSVETVQMFFNDASEAAYEI